MNSQWLKQLRSWARSYKCEIYALFLAAKHPETPWYAKVWLAGVVAYAFSPIDLIPDFIPILGYLDDLILLPIGIWIGIKMIPSKVMIECRNQAGFMAQKSSPHTGIAIVTIALIWCASLAAAVLLVLRYTSVK